VERSAKPLQNANALPLLKSRILSEEAVLSYKVTISIEGSGGAWAKTVSEDVSQEQLDYMLAVIPLAYSLPLSQYLREHRERQLAIASEHGHPGEPCRYLGMDMWDCGHVDRRARGAGVTTRNALPVCRKCRS
jgi:hypothetical protein